MSPVGTQLISTPLYYFIHFEIHLQVTGEGKRKRLYETIHKHKISNSKLAYFRQCYYVFVTLKVTGFHCFWVTFMLYFEDTLGQTLSQNETGNNPHKEKHLSFLLQSLQSNQKTPLI